MFNSCSDSFKSTRLVFEVNKLCVLPPQPGNPREVNWDLGLGTRGSWLKHCNK